MSDLNQTLLDSAESIEETPEGLQCTVPVSNLSPEEFHELIMREVRQLNQETV